MPFQPGQIANPSGVSSEIQKFHRKFKETIAAKSVDLVNKVIKMAESSKNESVRLRATELLLSYGFGKPSQEIALTDGNGGPAQISFVNIPNQQSRDEWLANQAKSIPAQVVALDGSLLEPPPHSPDHS